MTFTALTAWFSIPSNWNYIKDCVIEGNLIDQLIVTDDAGGPTPFGSGFGIDLENWLGGGVMENNRIINNTIKNWDDPGIFIGGFAGWFGNESYHRGTRIAGNTFENHVKFQGTGSVDAVIYVEGPLCSENTITGNTIGNIQDGGVEAIHVYAGAHHNTIENNDYRQSTLPGWTYDANGDVLTFGCIWLDSESSNNSVFESGNFPPGTGGTKKQVANQGTDNRVVGHRANEIAHLEQDNPGIGQKLQELSGVRSTQKQKEQRQEMVDILCQEGPELAPPNAKAIPSGTSPKLLPSN
jgi:hypothetical protein